jgi:hypothetical protein
VQDKEKQKVIYSELTFDEKQRLLGVFLWLIEQDKKQNPANYQLTKSK